jgi:DNA-binding HxlR family transcriptional regulator
MAPGSDEPEFNAGRAELFEALGHPIRIRILQSLDERPMGFAELKKAVGIESSGHLSFHLTKLEGLLRADNSGAYSLTDEGREALRVVSATRGSQSGRVKLSPVRPSLKKALITAAVVSLVLLGTFAVMQQQQIGTLSRQLSQQDSGTVMINGTRFAYVDVPAASLNYPAVVKFEGVTFNITSGATSGNIVVLTPVTGSGGLVIVTIRNGNGTQYLQGAPITFRAILSPSVRVAFSDGASESYVQNGFTTSNSGSASDLWLSHHTNPQAGVIWDSNTDSYILYVSLGS